MNRNAYSGLEKEVLKPILYTDIFDYPLTFQEVYKFLEVETTPARVKAWLDQAVERGQLRLVDGFYSLADRPHLAVKRRERQKVSEVLWPRATYYGRWIAALPFVRLVAVTGALAVDNPRDGVDDIDYLIVTRPGRLWLCRALIILMVKYGHKKGVQLCPNYLITENVLDFDDDFFTAREVLQMKPLYGQQVYLEIINRNAWVARYFPQNDGLNLDKMNENLSQTQRTFKKLGEMTLGGWWGDLLESRLQKIQITKHTNRARQIGARDTVIFTPDVCKGHYDGHNDKTMTAYRQRIQRYITQADLPPPNGKVRDLEIKQ
jgi:hypothetical protein